MTENQATLAGLAGKLLADIESQFAEAVGDFSEHITKAAEARKAELAGAKATPTDFVETGLELAKAIATETGNEKAIAIVDDLANTTEDGLEGKYMALFADLFKDFKDIKAATKK